MHWGFSNHVTPTKSQKKALIIQGFFHFRWQLAWFVDFSALPPGNKIKIFYHIW